jgi:hypothetical protein
VCHTNGLANLHLKSVLRQKKNYGNSNDFTMQKTTIFKRKRKKNPLKKKKNQNPSKYHNSGTDPKFGHKPINAKRMR